MKKFYKILALILVAAMLLCTCACATGGKADKKDKGSKEKDSAKDIVGEWECEYDLTDAIIEQISAQVGVDFSVSERCIVVIGLDLNKDGSCKLYVDKAASSANFEKFMPAYISGLVDATYKISEEQGNSREDMDAAFMTQYGCSVAEYVEQNLSMILNPDMLFDNVDDVEGFYQVNKDQLVLAEEEDEFDEAVFCEFELKGDKLSIISISEEGTDVEDFIEQFNLQFPIEFTR